MRREEIVFDFGGKREREMKIPEKERERKGREGMRRRNWAKGKRAEDGESDSGDANNKRVFRSTRYSPSVSLFYANYVFLPSFGKYFRHPHVVSQIAPQPRM